MPPLILPLDSEEASLALVGGKGANLAHLVRAGFAVPGGFLITTQAYRNFVEENKLAEWVLATAPHEPVGNTRILDQAASEIRERFSTGVFPDFLEQAIREAYTVLGSPPVAVRSSATAEDLPEMSFAGQQDTYLNIIGQDALIDAVINCWSSLWTARAMGYRIRNGLTHEELALAVVVQEMVPSEVAGVLFTANPLTGKRSEIVIDATLGLGEALVSGQVEPDQYVVDAIALRILSRKLGSKAIAIYGEESGGTRSAVMNAASLQALPDDVILELAELGIQITRSFNTQSESTPQDIEWAWAGRKLYILQSRPVTSLFPLPMGITWQPLRFLFSFGAVQGMLEPVTPIGQDSIRGIFAGGARLFGMSIPLEKISVIQMAAERLFIDATAVIRNRIGREAMHRFLGVIEPGVAKALDSLWNDPRLEPEGRFMRPTTLWRIVRAMGPIFFQIMLCLSNPDARRVHILNFIDDELDHFRAEADRAISLSQRLRLIRSLFQTVPSRLLRNVIPGLAGGMLALNLLNKLASSVPGGAQKALEVTRGLPHNVTTQMDLDLWEAARTIQADPDSIAYFEHADAASLADDYLAGVLPQTDKQVITQFMQHYGMRGIGEIDLGRPRWREDPVPVMQTIQSYLNIHDPSQAPDAIFRRGASRAVQEIDKLAAEIRSTPGGILKAPLLRWAASRMRSLAGLRELPKFFAVRLMGIVRDLLLESGRELATNGVLERAEDIFFLKYAELDAISSNKDPEMIASATRVVSERHRIYEREKRRKQIPLVLLSDGTVFYGGEVSRGQSGAENEARQFSGSPVSPGIVEGIVHVVLNPHGTHLVPGEILVCPGTDPAWTPLFLAAGGLVMEVGGLMTHGSVVAREYGIPAVVGVRRATSLLKSGQRIRVDGSTGRVWILEEEPINNDGR